MNDKQLAAWLRELAKEEREVHGDSLAIEAMEKAADRLDYLRWHDIEKDGPPPMKDGEWVLVIGEWDGVCEINTPIRSFGGVYQYHYWRRPANPVRRSFGSHKLESEAQQ